MVDAKQVIKQMREQGMTAAEIKASLQELGFENADELIKTALGEQAGAQASAPSAQSEPSAEGEDEAPPKELFEGFGERKPEKKSTPAKTEEEGEAPPADLVEEEKPAKRARDEDVSSEFKITSVSDEGEKEVSIQEMLAKAGAEKSGGSGGESVAGGRVEAGSLKAKLDDAVSLLKALQEINKKILETDREVLMRLKKT